MREVQPASPSSEIKYSDAVYTVTVIVSQAADNTLSCSVSYAPSDPSSATPVFVNETVGGPELPETGGPGLAPVYLMGGLILCVGVALMLKKKKK